MSFPNRLLLSFRMKSSLGNCGLHVIWPPPARPPEPALEARAPKQERSIRKPGGKTKAEAARKKAGGIGEGKSAGGPGGPPGGSRHLVSGEAKSNGLRPGVEGGALERLTSADCLGI